MKKTKKGFTLVELIVVIAIIGTLAAVIIPTMIGYVKEANKRADLETARQFGERIETEMVKDDSLYENFCYFASGSKTIYRGVYNYVGGIQETPYDFMVVTKIRAVKNGYYTSFEMGANREWKPFAKKLDALFDTSNGNPPYKMRATNHNGIKTDEWLIGYRIEKDARGRDVVTEKIEVWAGNKADSELNSDFPWINSNNGWGCNPRYRIWPNPSDEYTNFDD